MILVFGGTTEGRKAVEVLEEAGTAYYYSTKTGEQDVALHHGIRLDGAMDGEAMRVCCRQHAIRLVVDAAHPFASRLHETIADAAGALHIPVVRYERIYPPRNPEYTWIDDYTEVPADVHSLLATTGVQSIGKLKYLEAKGVRVMYRILPRESSIRLAHEQGAADSQLCYYEDGSAINVEAEAMLLTGGILRPFETSGASLMVSKVQPFSAAYGLYGQASYNRVPYFKYMKLLDEPVLAADYYAAKEAWLAGE